MYVMQMWSRFKKKSQRPQRLLTMTETTSKTGFPSRQCNPYCRRTLLTLVEDGSLNFFWPTRGTPPQRFFMASSGQVFLELHCTAPRVSSVTARFCPYSQTFRKCAQIQNKSMQSTDRRLCAYPYLTLNINEPRSWELSPSSTFSPFMSPWYCQSYT